MDEIQVLDIRRKQLRYRANHRGIKEMDIILGKFADHFLGEFDVGQLDDFERLIENNDRDLLQWFTAEIPVPNSIDPSLFAKISAFAQSGIRSSSLERNQ